MSHFTVLVVGEDVEGQLAPFDENLDTRNPKYDWWVIGGRWRGFFKLKRGAEGKLGEPGVFDNPPFLDADQAPKGDIDFQATRGAYAKCGTRFCTHAVLKDGIWYQQGEMCWFGVVADEKDPAAWQEEFDKLLAGVPDDALLTVVDCHV